MENLYFVGERNFRDDYEKKVKIKYFLVEEYEAGKGKKPVYGIEVIKVGSSDNKDIFEKEITPSISFSKTFVTQIIHKIMDNWVTPITVLEIVDDIITEEIDYKHQRG